MRATLTAASEDQVFFDPARTEGRYASLMRELPGTSVRCARKARRERGPVHMSKTAAPGDPVRILSCGAYATSRMAQGLDGLGPLPYAGMNGERPEGLA